MADAQHLQDLVDQIPAPDPNGTYAHLDPEAIKRFEKVLGELEAMGPEGILGLVDRLADPFSAAGIKARFALHRMAVRATEPGRQKARDQFALTLASQLGGTRPKAVQLFLIEQLQLAGTEVACPALAKVLGDQELCDPAARALVAIRQGAAEVLLAALPKAHGARRRSLIAKLGMLKAPGAVEAFRQALADDDPETRIAASWALARLADAGSVQALLRCADAHADWERIRHTDACMSLAENLAAAGKHQEAATIYHHLVKTRRDPADRFLREAAERGLAALDRHAAAQNAEEGFRPLFDGNSLAGWKVTENTAKSWKLQDGLLILIGGSNHLFTQEEFQDFVLRFQWRPLRKGYNSGLFVRGRQIQMAQSGAGMLFGSTEAKAVPQLHNPPGQWNEWEVSCIGTKLSLRVNGTLAWELDNFKRTSAPIGIEAEGHPIEFRAIRIKTVSR